MKRLLCVVLCILLAVAVVGCGAPEAEPSESAEASATVEPTPIYIIFKTRADRAA